MPSPVSTRRALHRRGGTGDLANARLMLYLERRMRPEEYNVGWTPATLRDEDYIVQLDDSVCSALTAASAPSDGRGPLGRSDLPDEAAALWPVARQMLHTGTGMCLLRGLPHQITLEHAHALSLLVGLGVGTPVFQDAVKRRTSVVQGGDDVDERPDNGRDGTRDSKTRHGVELLLHSDPSDVAGLLCLRTAPSGGLTRLASSYALHEHLRVVDPDAFEELYNVLPYAASDPSSSEVVGCPVFTWADGYFKAHIVPHLLNGAQLLPSVPKLTPRQRRAVAALAEFANSDAFMLHFALQPGDFLFVNNHLVFHGRDAYTDTDVSSRLLIRIWLAMRDSRPLDPKHHAWIGDTRAGALRGGIMPHALGSLEHA